MERKKKAAWIFEIIIAVCLIAAINAVLDVRYYRSYQEKTNILAEMLTTEQSEIIDTMRDILKESVKWPEEGRKTMEDYGYMASGQNRFESQFWMECFATALVSLILLAAFLLYSYYLKRAAGKEREELIAQMEECLLKFREDGTGPVRMDGTQMEILRLNHQLEALEDYLAMMREQAGAEKEETKSLVTDISHQLKTPVAALDTSFSILEDPTLDTAEREEFMMRCRNALNGLELLLHSLIQISRMETGMIQIEPQRAPILKTVVMAVNRVYPKASEKGIEISFESGDEMEGLQIKQDSKWLCEAIINLLENAVKYGKQNGEIKISLQKRISVLRIEIRDEGIGIPKEEYHKIFQRFYRGSLKKVREENGSGIGLYLAREIIQKHHGMITVSSDYEKSKKEYPGSMFLIQLPMEGSV